MKGQFITIEGLEGVGKTTQAEMLCSWLKQKGISFIRTREPGGTEIAEKIRSLVLEHHQEHMDPKTELLLVFAARQQHVEAKVKPAIEQGIWVVSDRFTDATYAYQGGGRQLDKSLIRSLELQVLNDFQPDLTLWFDCDAEIGLTRARARGELDRIETENIEFFNRCRAEYHNRLTSQPERFCRLDASDSISEVSKNLIKALELRYG